MLKLEELSRPGPEWPGIRFVARRVRFFDPHHHRLR